MPIELSIVTPEREAYSGTIDSVVLPGSEGDFGVLEEHERFLCPTRIGELAIHERERTVYAALSDGFIRVSDDRVVVLVETCELAEHIDVARAERAQQRAERRIQDIRAGLLESRELNRSGAALARAVIRIQVAGRWGDRAATP